MPLTEEQINEILGSIEPDQHGGYQPKAFVPKQVGPLRFQRDGPTKRCMHVTDANANFKSGTCGCPAFMTVQGKTICSLHALIVLNTMLVELGVTE
jgi:hypothetical protein